MKTLSEIYSVNLDPYSDGNNDKGTVHSYIEFYGQVLEPYRNTKNFVLEIGIKYGESIRMWREYFPNATIVGVDCYYHPNLSIENTIILHGDATIESTFEDLKNFDVIIDDGSHKLEEQLSSLLILFDKLNSGGIYLIEDVQNIDESWQIFQQLYPSAILHDFRKNKNRDDDVIIEIRKP